MPISNKLLKIIWAQSGGLCAFPDCKQELIAKDSNEILGHVCHIIAQNPAGPRGNAAVSESEINSTDNIILLCPTHHKLVDSEVDKYTAGVLQKMRTSHLAKIYDRLHQGTAWNVNFSQLYYANLPRISVLAAYNGIELNFDFMEHFSCLHMVGYNLGKLLLQVKYIMERLSVQTIQLQNDFQGLQVGQTISFENNFRTKNVPSIEAVCSKEYFPDTALSRTPQLYYSSRGQKLTLTIDPRWLATTTSFVNFHNGWICVAGLAIIKQVSAQGIIASPYLLGVPKSPLDALFSSSPPRTISF